MVLRKMCEVVNCLRAWCSVIPDANILVLISQVKITIKIKRFDRSSGASKMVLCTSFWRQIVGCATELSIKTNKTVVIYKKVEGTLLKKSYVIQVL